MNNKEFSRIYLAGYTARQNGKKEADNPYKAKPSMRLERDQWARGFNAAKLAKGRA